MATTSNDNLLLPLTPISFSFVQGRWEHALPRVDRAPSSIKLVTWNVDYQSLNASERLVYILDHLRDNLASPRGPPGTPDPCCILLQEVAYNAFDAILCNSWVRTHFAVVPASPVMWPRDATYGNVTLIEHTIPLIPMTPGAACSLVFGNSEMHRNALLVSIFLRDLRTRDPRPMLLHLANTHLESLPPNGLARVQQLYQIAQVLCGSGNFACIVAGDMNVMNNSDAGINMFARLRDAYVGREDEGYTWGFQPPTLIPPGRLDRIFVSDGAQCRVNVSSPQRIGVGWTTRFGRWLSDHYGLIATVSLET